MAAAAVALVLLAIGAVRGTHAQDDRYCYENPNDSECAYFKHPDEQADTEVTALCHHMSYMPGCEVDVYCDYLREQAGDGDLDEYSKRFCDPFSVLADICYDDMPTMNDCENFTLLCAPGSKVHQCEDEGKLPGLPTTMKAKQLVKSICDSHYMEGCSDCVLDNGDMADPYCDIVSVYSTMCLVMPDMPECGDWKTMCAAVPTWYLWCPSDDPAYGQSPIMRMYFHTGIVDYVLFYGWVPRTNWEYALTMLAVIVLGMLYEAVRTYRHYCECRWAGSVESATATVTEYRMMMDENSGRVGLTASTTTAASAPANTAKTMSPGWAPQPFRFWIDLARAGLQALETVFSYSLMLIAMTFNVGLFFAVIVGLFLGTFLFGRYRSYQPANACC